MREAGEARKTAVITLPLPLPLLPLFLPAADLVVELSLAVHFLHGLSGGINKWDIRARAKGNSIPGELHNDGGGKPASSAHRWGQRSWESGRIGYTPPPLKTTRLLSYFQTRVFHNLTKWLCGCNDVFTLQNEFLRLCVEILMKELLI